MAPFQHKPQSCSRSCTSRASSPARLLVGILFSISHGPLFTSFAGKATIYHAIQPPYDPASSSPETLAALDEAIASHRTAIAELRGTERTLRARLAALQAVIPLPELRESVTSLRAEQAELTDRLKELKDGRAKKVSKREREEVEGEWHAWKRRAERRRKAFYEMWGAVGEGLPEGAANGQELWVSIVWRCRSWI